MSDNLRKPKTRLEQYLDEMQSLSWCLNVGKTITQSGYRMLLDELNDQYKDVVKTLKRKG